MRNYKEEKIDIDKIITWLGVIVKTMQENPQQALKDLRRIGAKIDSQIPYRDGHSIRIADYCLCIAGHLGFTENEKLTLEVAALLHDFGKIAINQDILSKPGRLNNQEKKEVELHVMRGYYMLAGFNELLEALQGIKSHHEFYDGTGYPEGLSESGIPLMGRIIAVTDAYDAMTSDRPYRKAMTKDAAIRELKDNAGKQFDPSIVSIFVNKCLSLHGEKSG